MRNNCRLLEQYSRLWFVRFPTSFILEDETLAAAYRVLRPGGCLVIVPSGRLTGSGMVARGIEWLYTVTGQRDGDPTAFVEAVRRAGFDVSTAQAVCPGSVVMIVFIAEKPNFGSDKVVKSAILFTVPHGGHSSIG